MRDSNLSLQMVLNWTWNAWNQITTECIVNAFNCFELPDLKVVTHEEKVASATMRVNCPDPGLPEGDMVIDRDLVYVGLVTSDKEFLEEKSGTVVTLEMEDTLDEGESSSAAESVLSISSDEESIE